MGDWKLHAKVSIDEKRNYAGDINDEFSISFKVMMIINFFDLRSF